MAMWDRVEHVEELRRRGGEDAVDAAKELAVTSVYTLDVSIQIVKDRIAAGLDPRADVPPFAVRYILATGGKARA